MTNKVLYPLNGADRFQVFFDSVARRNTGVGNVIRAVVTLGGRIPEPELKKKICGNPAVLLLSRLQLKKKRFTPLFLVVEDEKPPSSEKFIHFHDQENPELALGHALARDCNLREGSPLHIDVIYDEGKTWIVFSVSHILMDYAGMENFMGSVFEDREIHFVPEITKRQRSFLKVFLHTIEATFFVAARTAWSMKRLSEKTGISKAAFEKLEFEREETGKIKIIASDVVRTNALSFYLACSLYALHLQSDWLEGKREIYFTAVPLERRSAGNKKTLLSNFHSYIYFHAKTQEMKSRDEISRTFTARMIQQARRHMPEKFSALMELFRFIPAPVYRAFIDLPTNGHSGTFAFSLLANSRLEKKIFLDFPIIDVTHYAPVISPPGLNIAFNEFEGKLKIVLSYDEKRLSKIQAREFLEAIRKNMIA